MKSNIWNYRIIEAIFFIFILIAFLAIDDFFAIQRFNGIGINTQGNFAISEYIRQAVFVGEYLIAALSFYYVTKLNKKLGLPILLMLWVLLLIDASIHQIIGTHADIFYISAINGAVGNISDALSHFNAQILSSLGMTSILMIPLIIKTSLPSRPKKGYRAFILMGMLIFAYGFILIVRGSPALIGFPKGYAYGYGSVFLLINDITLNFHSDDHIKTELYSANSSINKIIVIVDESIEYNEFSKLYEADNPHSIDFGQSYSGANCSTSSNYIIRRATWDRNTSIDKLDIKKVESLFSLAKNMSFRTVYIDNQNVLKDPTVRNYFDKHEVGSIDTIIVPEGNIYDRDLNSLSKVEDELQHENVFIFINKLGAHFPYENTIPKALVKLDKMDNYRSSVNRNTISYLKKLSKIIDDKTIIFYTSDHGQDFNSRATQCNTGNGVSDLEYSVPFIVITKDSDTYQSLINVSHRYRDILTHIEFSESIRNAIGYEIKEIKSIFKNGEILTNKYCGLYGQPKPFFGINPSCKQIR